MICHDFAPFVHISDQIEHGLVTTHAIGRVAAWDDDRVLPFRLVLTFSCRDCFVSDLYHHAAII